jgi:hypothetical protein
MAPALFILAIGAVGPGYLLAKRVGPIVPFAFIAAYVLAVGTIAFINIAVFDMIDPKFRQAWLRSWLEVYWPLWIGLLVPSAISALLACWYSRPSTWRDATALLGVYLFLILVAIVAASALHLHLGFWLLVALPSTIFFAMALVKRVAQGQRHASAP